MSKITYIQSDLYYPLVADKNVLSDISDAPFFALLMLSVHPYELPCKIWSLLLKKWASYGTWYERGQTSIYHLYSSDYTVQTLFLVLSKKKLNLFGWTNYHNPSSFKKAYITLWKSMGESSCYHNFFVIFIILTLSI